MIARMESGRAGEAQQRVEVWGDSLCVTATQYFTFTPHQCVDEPFGLLDGLAVGRDQSPHRLAMMISLFFR
jgi:hypothetical protein